MANALGRLGEIAGGLRAGGESTTQQFLQGLQSLNQQKAQLANQQSGQRKNDIGKLNALLGAFNAGDKAGLKAEGKDRLFNPILDTLREDFDIDIAPGDSASQGQVAKALENNLSGKATDEQTVQVIQAIGQQSSALQTEERTALEGGGVQQPPVQQQPESMFGEEQAASPFSSIDPAKFTPESIGKFEESGSFADLVSKSESLQGIDVQSSKILSGGLAQIVTKDGKFLTVPAKEADKLLIKLAEERGAELQGLRSGERESAKISIANGKKFFEKSESILDNIDNLNEGIRLLRDEGARTGAITRFLPSITAATRSLKNLQGRLGLDVIQNTTFGALSENELKFALDVALPEGLNEPELQKWLTDKRDAQIKLFNYMRGAASFLLEPGNTIPEFIAIQKVNQRATTRTGKPIRGKQAEGSEQPTAPTTQKVGRFTIEVAQ